MHGQGRAARPVPPLPRTLVSGSGGLAVFLTYCHEPVEHAREASTRDDLVESEDAELEQLAGCARGGAFQTGQVGPREPLTVADGADHIA